MFRRMCWRAPYCSTSSSAAGTRAPPSDGSSVWTNTADNDGKIAGRSDKEFTWERLNRLDDVKRALDLT